MTGEPDTLSAIDERIDADELPGLIVQVRQVLEHPGWQHLRRFLAAKQHAQVEITLRRPSANLSSDGYALQQAHAAGYARGLRDADLIGGQVLERAEARLRRDQQAAEYAAQREEA